MSKVRLEIGDFVQLTPVYGNIVLGAVSFVDNKDEKFTIGFSKEYPLSSVAKIFVKTCGDNGSLQLSEKKVTLKAGDYIRVQDVTCVTPTTFVVGPLMPTSTDGNLYVSYRRRGDGYNEYIDVVFSPDFKCVSNSNYEVIGKVKVEDDN